MFSVKKVLFEILQNSQENTCARVSFSIFFLRNTSGSCFSFSVYHYQKFEIFNLDQLGPIREIQEKIIIPVFHKKKPYKHKASKARSLKHLRTLKASKTHFLKKLANKQLILLFTMNAKNILRTIFGLKSANLGTLEGFLQVECFYRKICSE